VEPRTTLDVGEKAFPVPLLRMKPLLLRLWQYKETSMHLLGIKLCLPKVLPKSMVDPPLDNHIGHLPVIADTMKTIIYSSVVNKHSARFNTKELCILMKLDIYVISIILPID